MDFSVERFGCCGFYKECTVKGDCVRKRYWINYKLICSLYRKTISKMEVKA